MARFIYIILLIALLPCFGLTQDRQIAKEDLSELKFNLLKLQFVSAGKVYLQSYDFHEEKEAAISYINNNAPIVFKGLKLNYSNYVFDSLLNIIIKNKSI